MTVPARILDTLIARPTAEGFAGVTVFRDEPATLRYLMNFVADFGPDLAIRTLIEDHPSGWWSIPTRTNGFGQCACHAADPGDRKPALLLTETTALLQGDITHVYLLQPRHLELFDRGGGQWAARGAIPYDMWSKAFG